MPALALVHVPPGTVLESVMLLPMITVIGPEITPAFGAAFTVTCLVLLQPVLFR
jgi:hypothetical protein